MAMTERSRSVLFQGLSGMIDDEVAVGELLSYFPARDVEEPATKEFVAAQISDVRTEVSDVRTEIAGLRGELHAEVAGLRAEMAAMEMRLTTQLATQLAAHQRASIQWTLGALVSIVALVLAMGFLQGP